MLEPKPGLFCLVYLICSFYARPLLANSLAVEDTGYVDVESRFEAGPVNYGISVSFSETSDSVHDEAVSDEIYSAPELDTYSSDQSSSSEIDASLFAVYVPSTKCIALLNAVEYVSGKFGYLDNSADDAQDTMLEFETQLSLSKYVSANVRFQSNVSELVYDEILDDGAEPYENDQQQEERSRSLETSLYFSPSDTVELGMINTNDDDGGAIEFTMRLTDIYTEVWMSQLRDRNFDIIETTLEIEFFESDGHSAYSSFVESPESSYLELSYVVSEVEWYGDVQWEVVGDVGLRNAETYSLGLSVDAGF